MDITYGTGVLGALVIGALAILATIALVFFIGAVKRARDQVTEDDGDDRI